MKRSELKQLIREAVEEVMQEFAPLGVAEGIPSSVRSAAEKAGGEPKDYKQAWKNFYAQHGDAKKATKQVKEMWIASESKSLNEAEEMDQNEKHDETDLSNPEENREVELANKIKALANELLGMHGVKDEEGGKEESEKEEGSEENVEEKK